MFSVIIPTYNRPEMLRRAVRTVMDQLYRDFEVIVVDDFSSVPAAEVLGAEFGREMSDGILRVYRNDCNRDKSFCRNFGASQARGQWLAFLDDDDAWTEEYLSTAAGFLAGNPEVELMFAALEVKSGTKTFFPNADIATGRGKKYRDMCLLGQLGSPCAAVVRRTVFESSGGYDETISVYEDRHLFARIAMKHEVGFVQKPTVIVYVRPGRSYSYEKGARGMALEKEKVVNDLLLRLSDSGYALPEASQAEMLMNLVRQLCGVSYRMFVYAAKVLRKNPTLGMTPEFRHLMLRGLIINVK